MTPFVLSVLSTIPAERRSKPGISRPFLETNKSPVRHYNAPKFYSQLQDATPEKFQKVGIGSLICGGFFFEQFDGSNLSTCVVERVCRVGSGITDNSGLSKTAVISNRYCCLSSGCREWTVAGIPELLILLYLYIRRRHCPNLPIH